MDVQEQRVRFVVAASRREKTFRALCEEFEVSRPTRYVWLRRYQAQLKAERADLEKQAIRVVDAIGQHGFSSFLSAQLSTVESRMAEIDRLLTARPAPKPPTFTDEQIAEFVRQECHDFCNALTGDPEFARQEIQKRIKSLVLTPKETPEGPVLEVSGDVALL